MSPILLVRKRSRSHFPRIIERVRVLCNYTTNTFVGGKGFPNLAAP